MNTVGDGPGVVGAVDVTLARVDERLRGRIRPLATRVRLDVCELAGDDVHEHGPAWLCHGNCAPAAPCSRPRPCGTGRRRRRPSSPPPLLELDLQVDLVGEDRPWGQRLGGDRGRRILRRRRDDADRGSRGEHRSGDSGDPCRLRRPPASCDHRPAPLWNGFSRGAASETMCDDGRKRPPARPRWRPGNARGWHPCTRVLGSSAAGSAMTTGLPRGRRLSRGGSGRGRETAPRERRATASSRRCHCSPRGPARGRRAAGSRPSTATAGLCRAGVHGRAEVDRCRPRVGRRRRVATQMSCPPSVPARFELKTTSSPSARTFGWMSFAAASLSSPTAVAGPKRAPFCRSLT